MAIERIKVLDYRRLGQKFIDWALGNTPRPADGDLAGFVAQTQGILDVLPAYINDFKMVQAPNKSLLLLRLPPADIVQDTLNEIAGPGDYRLPDFYEERFLENQHTDKLEFFQYRVGDYLIAHCA